jgi:protein SCO1
MSHVSRARRALLASALIAAAFSVAGCGQIPGAPTKLKFNSIDVSGASFGKDFRLTDHNGNARSLADYRGKAVVLFFGFTQCPDVCPTTLLAMKDVREKLGAKAEKLQVLFASVDPKRDTQELLSKYVPAFHPSFVGLRGDEAQTAQVIKDFKLVVEIVPGPTPTSYLVNHTTFAYVFDAQGHLRLMVDPTLATDKIAADLMQLL